MLGHFKKNLKNIWHDVYYFFASEKAVDFAMTCREATEKIDLKDPSTSIRDQFRVKLHVSLCQACHNYESFSRSLSKAIQRLISSEPKNKNDLEKLNNELIKKFSK